MSTRDEHDDLLLERLKLDPRSGPAPRISSARAQALVQAAMNDAYAAGMLAPDAPAAVPANKPGIMRSPWLRAFAMAAAGLLMLVGGAAAAKLVMQAIWPQAAPVQAPEPPKQVVTPKVSHAVAPVAPSDAPEVEEAIEGAQDVRPPAPVKTVRREDRELDKVSEDLLQAANRARAAGQFREAADTYAEVYERTPSSLSAYVAEVAAGSLELEHLDRPDRAARLFRRALRSRPGGALDLEARQGLATALHDLGRERDEIAALKALVAAHPNRPAAQRARARLSELGVSLTP